MQRSLNGAVVVHGVLLEDGFIVFETSVVGLALLNFKILFITIFYCRLVLFMWRARIDLEAEQLLVYRRAITERAD